MKKAIIIGATSGIGRELAKLLAKNGYVVGIAGRRRRLLAQLQKEIPSKTYSKRIDISKAEEAISLLRELWSEMGGIDLIVISAAVNLASPKIDWKKEREVVAVNVAGFVAIANAAAELFAKQGHGHIVGISSVASHKYSSRSTAYCASKAFVSSYLRGLREKLRRMGANVHVTEVLPGFVATPMISYKKGVFWVMSPKKAAACIYAAIKRKRKKAYITKRWFLVAMLLRMLPDSLKSKI
jgi:hypothetical protein